MSKRNNYLSAYMLLTPTFLLFAVFIFYPTFFVAKTSLYSWDGMSPDKAFVGIKNYIEIFQNGYLPIVFKNLLIISVFVIVLQSFLGLILAECIRKEIALSGFFRSVIFMPVVLTPVVIGYIFSHMLESNFGFINTFLRNIGLPFLAQNWLSNPKIAMYVIGAINTWQWVGFSMVIYIAGMTSISTEIYEACDIDGASPIQKFCKITFPLLKSSHATLTVLGAISSIKAFDIIWVLTAGGPGITTSSFSTLIFKESFLTNRQGTSSALSVLLIVCALLVTIVQNKLYDNDKK